MAQKVMHSHHRNFEHMKMERRKLNDTLSHPQSHPQNSTINSVTYFHLLFPLSFLQGGPNLSFSWAPQLSEQNTSHLCTDQKSGGSPLTWSPSLLLSTSTTTPADTNSLMLHQRVSSFPSPLPWPWILATWSFSWITASLTPVHSLDVSQNNFSQMKTNHVTPLWKLSDWFPVPWK